MALPDTPRGYVAQFDGLRGVAVILVLVEHFTFNEWIRGWSPGSVGVRTFFVLSGFLITGLLLSDRDRFSVGMVARRFFRNRALRLLPPFVVVVTLAAALGIAEMRSDWLWHASYLSNVQIAIEERWSGAGHFWTLAVEQQFYLLWFPLVVVAPRRWLAIVAVAMVVCAMAFRGLIASGSSPFLDVLFPAQMDALALGAVLAVLARGRNAPFALRWIGHPAVMWGLIGMVALISAPLPAGDWADVLAWVVRPSLIALAAASVIAAALSGGERLGTMRWPVLTGLGRISYGLYLFHYFVPQALNLYVPFVAGLTEGPGKVLRVGIWVALSVLLAMASWHWIEKPALRRKAGVVWRKGASPAGMPENN